MTGIKFEPAPNKGILDIAPYVPGKDGADQLGKVIKLSSNETPLGASPKAIKAYEAGAQSLAIYPDSSAGELRKAIAKRYGLDAERIICGAGSDELLSLLAQAYLGPGDEAIHTKHGFLVYEIAIRTNGATPIVADEIALCANVDQILACVSERTKLIFLANPNNPTGTYLPIDELRALHAQIPKHVILVVDAAYAEYVTEDDYQAGIELVGAHDNVVMTRTFSKIHGLAALRLGWAYCSASIADVLNRIRGPFNVNMPAIYAGIAALEDQAFMEKAVAHNAKWRDWLETELPKLGLEITKSVANFVLIHFPEKQGLRAAEADAFLTKRGLILRRLENYHLGAHLRMTVGTEQANKAVVSALKEFMAGGD